MALDYYDCIHTNPRIGAPPVMAARGTVTALEVSLCLAVTASDVELVVLLGSMPGILRVRTGCVASACSQRSKFVVA